jgi:D-lactate dehydrogenase
MAKIAFFEVEDWEKKHIEESLKSHEITFFRESLTKSHVPRISQHEIIAVFIYSEVGKDILAKLPRLKLVTTMSTGFDHIDLKECKKRGITVCNVPTYGANTVAEHTFGLILTITRKIGDAVKRARKGDFTLEGLRGYDLKGKTIGVVGCGNIGKHVVRIAKGFEMNVLVYDVNKSPKLAKRMGFRYVSLDNVLGESDIVTLHAPHNKSTHHMINSRTIKLMKKGAVLINTARGGLVDTAALLKALDNGSVSAAGLDVLEGECFIKEEKQLLHRKFAKICDLKNVLRNHAMLKKKNVYITPHNAFNSEEALRRILDTTIGNIKAFLKKKQVNTVK